MSSTRAAMCCWACNSRAWPCRPTTRWRTRCCCRRRRLPRALTRWGRRCNCTGAPGRPIRCVRRPGRRLQCMTPDRGSAFSSPPPLFPPFFFPSFFFPFFFFPLSLPPQLSPLFSSPLLRTPRSSPMSDTHADTHAESPAVASEASGVPRRRLLAGMTGMVAAAALPAVHAQEKIVLRYLGTAVNQDKAIAQRFQADTGIAIQYVAVTTDDVSKRAVTAPNSFELIDTEFFSLKKIVPTGNLRGIDSRRIKNADKITTLFTTGMGAGKAVGEQGTAPKKVIYLEGEKSRKVAAAPTQYMSLSPTVYNADTLGIRPDLIGRPIDSWAELLNPEFKGRTALLNIPSIGIMDAAMVVEAMGIYKYPDKGNMTRKEIDLTIKTLIEAKKQGQFRA